MNRRIAWCAAAAVLTLVSARGHVRAFQATDTATSQLVWYDRAGKRLTSVGNPADYGTLELSPDGKQAAVAVLDRSKGTSDIWLMDVASGGLTRLTSDPADENWAIWSPDSKRLAFNSTRTNQLDLFEAPASGAGPEDILLKDNVAKWPVSWSPDGRNILYVISVVSVGPNGARVGRNSIWVLPLFGNRKPYAYLDDASVSNNWPAFSPDGKWVAFASTPTGGLGEVYVAAFPATGGRRIQVSQGGGFQARWRSDGKELFFVASDWTLMAAAVASTGTAFTAQPAKPLFDMRFAHTNYRAYAPSLDGQRFLVNTLVAAPSRGNSTAENLDRAFVVRTVAQLQQALPPPPPPPPSPRALAEAAFQRGTAALAKQDTSTAITEFTQTIRLDASLPSPRYWLGQAYLRTKEYDAALLALLACRDAYRKIPLAEPAFVPLSIGSAYMHLGRFPEAEREYRQALAIDDRFGEAHNNLAVIYMLTGLFDHAQEEVAAAEKAGYVVDPNFKRELKDKSGAQ